MSDDGPQFEICTESHSVTSNTAAPHQRHKSCEPRRSWFRTAPVDVETQP